MSSSNLENKPSKVCRVCGEEKGLEEFFRRKKGSEILRTECKTCIAKKNKAWRYAVPGRDRKRFLKRAYGITPEQYTEMLEEQGGVCAANGCDSSRGHGVLYVDHCHKTGRVRGLLCHSCNTALGHVFDNADKLRGLIQYLER